MTPDGTATPAEPVKKAVRVACHPPDDGLPFAYRYGSVEAMADPLSGKTTDIPDLVRALIVQAKDEYPDHDIVVERLVGDEHGEWEPDPTYEGDGPASVVEQ